MSRRKFYEPDYFVPTSEVLKEWLDDNSLSTSVAAVAASGRRDTARHAAATAALDAVLNNGKVDSNAAGLLEAVTGISAQFWLAFEHNYRTRLRKVGEQ